MNQSSQYLSQTDDVDLLKIIAVLWRGKWKIFLGALALAVLVVFYSLSLPNEYTASTLLSPAKGKSQEGASGLGGLAGLAGIRLGGGGGANETRIAIEVLQSRKFLIDFVIRREIAPELLAGQSFNVDENRWVYNDEAYNSADKRWVEQEPGDWALYKGIQGKLVVKYDDREGLITVTLSSFSPEASSIWLSWLIEDLNRELMEKEVVEAEKSIAYLQEKIRETALTEMRQVFYQLIEQQTRTIMLARSKPEYALATIDPPLKPVRKSAPQRALMVIMAGILGGIVMSAYVLISAWRRAARK